MLVKGAPWIKGKIWHQQYTEYIVNNLFAKFSYVQTFVNMEV